MPTITGGAAIVESLRAEKVTDVFGLIGSAGMEIFDALYDAKDIRFIGVRDERTGVHMADGYARASGRAGIFLAGQNGPGVTNTVTGVAQAYAAYSPVIVLAGSLSTAHVYRDAFQEVDQLSLFKPITKKTWTVTQSKRLPEMVREAFRSALSPRRGPVVLNLPRDILAETFDLTATDVAPSVITAVAAGAPESVRDAARMLAAAKRPLIVTGGGIKNVGTHAQVLRLAELLHAPVVLSPGHGDAIPCDHPLYGGQMGPRGNEVASDAARKADVILALGTRLGFNTTFYSYDNINRDAKIIHVELDAAAIGRYFPAAIGILGDAGTIATQLSDALAAHRAGDALAWEQDFRGRRTEMLRKRDAEVPTGEPIQPAALFKALRDVAPADAMYTMDAGTLCLQATDQLNFRQSPSLFTPLDFGLVGFSYACGLGLKAACPDRSVISLMGDGGFGMTMSELSTAVASKLNTVCVVMNNGCWGAEKAYQRDFFGGRYLGADVLNPPYDKVAELFGAAGFRVDRQAQIGDAIRAALSCGKPAIVDVMIDPDALYSFRRDSFQHRVTPGAAK
jgi:thiamine pyrophosphate-dependent acetolactate synthase large subunit-like protein